ncbi:translation initiation factor 3, RNA-binding subunit [Wallemia mellicola]|uniref:Eukaryotic translation initiation factor 3 subunit G n=1 Tax=Wallemia mellicola TaxID=1708541 RepID=A0A4T0LUY2_9BASI|nr:hypothetical protein E3Q23_03894 [Wallemia mellicola]TIB73884.1 translation initiation factor 3, RNA-binding subunit [Wallemia mellicola]TIB96669.1 translation initiation factor 3, RNA-binding subunit [Wallemia mellicola]TIB97461.1 translation initiation factor 3, RNA-binding subunit [Wallemia mellicola]TIC08655.1 translation initiation factor 3, RNA-binding subunit [Wallemia mellicola]
MSKSSLNLSRNSTSNARSSTSVDNNVAVDSVLNDLLTIELIPTLRTSTEEEMKRDDRDITEESVDEELTKKLKQVGTSIGHTVAERIKQTREPLNDNLEVIKLLCKEIWTFIYGKQLDNLRTNHKGTFVLHDNSYRPLVNLSSSDEINNRKFLSIQLETFTFFLLSTKMSTDKLQSTSWADDVDETIAAPEPQIKTITTPDSDVITTIEVLADRKTWPKFGLEKGKPAGPDRATTTVGENVVLKLSAGNDSAVEEPSEEQLMKERLKSKKIVCRLCKGDHFTTKCPYKSTLGDLDSAQDSTQTPDESNANQGTAAAATSTGKYIPPSQRAGARASGAGPGGPSRDEYPTLRVTNVSEDTHEDDLRELFRRFGRVQRVFIGRDRETRASKGFAFVSFELRSDAEKALEKVNGMGYDNLILSVQWSQPRDK